MPAPRVRRAMVRPAAVVAVAVCAWACAERTTEETLLCPPGTTIRADGRVCVATDADPGDEAPAE